ncbi:MAG: NTP transferase domain-containing protein [Planctomycetales bacterium]|nr:NTP transferase domain-containing protein [Planctomycetales bacterium]
MHDTLVVIPARGGSRRIPRKPLALVCGRSLLWYTLDYVQSLGLAEASVVVTDDDDIAALAVQHGVDVVREPTVTAEAENTIRAAYRAIQEAERRGRTIHRVVLLQPTQPVRPPDVVDRCLDGIGGEADAALTVHAPCCPPELMAEPNGELLRFEDYRLRQDCATRYRANGLCYAWSRAAFDAEPESITAFHRQRTYRAVVTEPFPYVDIDEPHDLEHFEYLLRQGHTPWNVGVAQSLSEGATA